MFNQLARQVTFPQIKSDFLLHFVLSFVAYEEEHLYDTAE